MKRYFLQVASGGGAFGFFCGGKGVLCLILISDGTGTVRYTVFELFSPVCAGK
jgi:hypothetical protein